jgi:predicted phage terminase large subunit-like protein
MPREVGREGQVAARAVEPKDRGAHRSGSKVDPWCRPMSRFTASNIANLMRIGSADPTQRLINVERELVARGGLGKLISLAWPQLEGGSKPFVRGWHIDAICEHLTAVSNGDIKRLAISMPPRHMKSLTVSVLWLAWDWIDHPWRQFLFASYAQSLAFRDSVKTRRLITSPWYQQRWGNRFKLTGDQNTKSRFENNKNGHRLSTSVGGATTGEGGDIVIVDDAHNVRGVESEKTRTSTLEWWDEALSSRLNNPKTGAYVLVQQRVHENDLMGHVLKQNVVEPWTTLCLPAEFEPDHPQRWFRDPRKELGELLWPAQMGRREVDDLKQRLGPYATAAQLQQRPSPRSGGVFKRSWFPGPYIKVAPGDTQWVRAWDFAGTEAKMIKADPDYTASALVGWSTSAQCWFIGHVERFREEAHVVEQRVKQRAEQDGTSVQIQLAQDPGQAGKGQAQNYLRLLGRFSASATPVTGDKMARALSWAGKAGNGLVRIVEGEWNKAFLDELTSFPTGAHDDQVDAVSSAFDKLVNNTYGLIDYYEQQLRAKGVDTSTIQTSLQREEQAVEAARQVREKIEEEQAAIMRCWR